jgi:hypothetical protein
VMSQRMLRGIKERAERAVVATTTSGASEGRRFGGESAHVAPFIGAGLSDESAPDSAAVPA